VVAALLDPPYVEPREVPNVEGDKASTLIGRPSELGIVWHGLPPQFPDREHVEPPQAQCPGSGHMDVRIQKEAQWLALTFGQGFFP